MTAKKSTEPVEAVSTPEVTQPASAQQPAYDPNMYYRKPASKAKWLTFEYAVAMVSTVLVAGLLVHIMTALFGLWFGATTSVLTASVGGWITSVLSTSAITPGTGIVAASVLTVLLSIIAYITFGRVSRAISERSGYTDRLAYKVVTYGGFAAVVVPSLVLVAKLVGVLISSLLFIGVSNAGDVYASLYLAEFLPYVLSLGVLGYTAFCLRNIIDGRNSSKVLTLVLIVVTSVILFAGAVTVAVKTHSVADSYNDATRSTLKNLDKYFDF